MQEHALQLPWRTACAHALDVPWQVSVKLVFREMAPVGVIVGVADGSDAVVVAGAAVVATHNKICFSISARRVFAIGPTTARRV